MWMEQHYLYHSRMAKNTNKYFHGTQKRLQKLFILFVFSFENNIAYSKIWIGSKITFNYFSMKI